jgi:hypothetical protein
MNLAFEPISLERREEYTRALEACPHVTSDYAFANIWGWGGHYGLEWAVAGDLVGLRQTSPRTVYRAPVGPWDRYAWGQCDCLFQVRDLTRVPEALARVWKQAFDGRIRVTAARDHWDYVYAVPDLIALPGETYRKKREQLEQFKASNLWQYSCMTADCVEEVLDMQADWFRWREEENEHSPALQAENEAITRVLQHMDRLPRLMGGTVRVEGRIKAYTVAECLSRDTLVIHFEKADTRFAGAYQAINQMFLEHSAKDFAFVNREQDLGEEGLRKAKLSYNPARFEKKYDVAVG